jgi:ribosomal protein S18 acetylase RimI-like enzyme
MLIQPPPHDHDRAGATLGRAFSDDPLWAATFSDPDSRPETLVRMFTALIKATAAARGVIEATSDVDGVAVWMPPGTNIGLSAMVKSGLALPRFAMGLQGPDRKRMMMVMRQLGDRRKTLMPDQHWYLAAIGVSPDRRGEGLGSELVQSGIAAADQASVPIYLETETAANVDWYRGRGFEVVEQVTATGLGLPLWLMIRRPTAGG